jgi:DNA polymerase-4
MMRILHIDMDAFFAAVEQKRHPELIGKPVVIGGEGDPTKRGVVSTASYEARKFGIHSAMPLRTAYRLCPEAIFLPVDYKEYSRVSEIIKGILREIIPLMEDVGIDEAFLDISDISRLPEEISLEIKKKSGTEQD